MNEIERQLNDARQKLLDLTMRNQLINFRPSKRRTLRVVDEIPQEIFDILVLKELSMSFLSKKVNDKDVNRIYNENDNNNNHGFSKEEVSVLWSLPPPEPEISKRHRDRFLQTQLESEILQKHLFWIFQQSRSILEEQGYTILYLALGFLEWFESPSSDSLKRAPIILIPVELTSLNYS